MRSHGMNLLKLLATLTLIGLLVSVLSMSFKLMNEANTGIVFIAIGIIVVAVYVVLLGAWKLWAPERKRILEWMDQNL